MSSGNGRLACMKLSLGLSRVSVIINRFLFELVRIKRLALRMPAAINHIQGIQHRIRLREFAWIQLAETLEQKVQVNLGNPFVAQCNCQLAKLLFRVGRSKGLLDPLSMFRATHGFDWWQE